MRGADRASAAFLFSKTGATGISVGQFECLIFLSGIFLLEMVATEKCQTEKWRLPGRQNKRAASKNWAQGSANSAPLGRAILDRRARA
jgi:hypothetical protein